MDAVTSKLVLLQAALTPLLLASWHMLLLLLLPQQLLCTAELVRLL
jgi:hypothetical protein